MNVSSRALAAALAPGLPHGACRLYVILGAVEKAAGAEGKYFQVTLSGLMRLHPGVGGRTAGATTIMKQVMMLRSAGLLETRAAMHRTDPGKPVLVRLFEPPAPPSDVMEFLADVANSE